MTTQQILQGVHDWTNGKIVYDISVAHPDGQGKPTPYADLTAALGTGGANIPQGLRKGGMSVKFIKGSARGSAQGSDNKYVQFRCMAQSFTTDVIQWQGVDSKPISGSLNIPESSGTFNSIKDATYFTENPDNWISIGHVSVSAQGVWDTGDSYESKYFMVDTHRGESLYVHANNIGNTIISFLTSIDTSNRPIFANGETGRHIITNGNDDTFVIPSNAVYAVLTTTNSNQNRTPSSVYYTKDRITRNQEAIEGLENRLSAVEPVVSSNAFKIDEKLSPILTDVEDAVFVNEDPTTWVSIGNVSVSSAGIWDRGDSYESKYFLLEGNTGKDLVVYANNIGNTIISFLTSIDTSTYPRFATGETGRHIISKNEHDTLHIPNDAIYAVLTTKNSNQDRTPSLVYYKEQRITNLENWKESAEPKIDNSYNAIRHEIVPSINFTKIINGSQKYENNNDYNIAKLADVSNYRGLQITVNNSTEKDNVIAFLVSSDINSENPLFCMSEASRIITSASSTATYIIPNDCKYMYITVLNGGKNCEPTITVNTPTAELQKRNYIVENEYRYNLSNYIPWFLKKFNFDYMHIGLSDDYNNCYGLLYNIPIGYKIHYDTTYINVWRIRVYDWDGLFPKTSSNYADSDWLKGIGEITIQHGNAVIVQVNANGISVGSIASIKKRLNLWLSSSEEDTVTKIRDINQSMPVFKYSYEGEKISFNTLAISQYRILENWHNMQGGAIYGDYLVCLMATDELDNPSANGFIYNIKTSAKVSDLLFGSTLGSKTYTMPHANQVSFGTEFYNEDSDFPLMYVSQVNGSTSTLWQASERGVLVYDLQDDGNGGYTPVLVQAIIPDLTDTTLMTKLGKYTPNYIVDTDNNQIVIIGYPNESWFDLTGPQPIAVIDLPSILDGNEIVFTDNDVVDNYTLPVSKSVQQSFYVGGKVYTLGGNANSGSIRVIDLVQKKVVTNIDLTQFTNLEPQFIGLWNNIFLYYNAGATGLIYKFDF